MKCSETMNKLKKIAEDDETFFEMKEYLLDHLGANPNGSIDPEQGFYAIDINYEYQSPIKEIWEDYRLKLDEFNHRFWCEKLAPIMDRTSFFKLIESNSLELDNKFLESLLGYLEKIEK